MKRATAVCICLTLAGCQQKMAEQPSYRPLQYSAFFADERAARPPVAGTVAWEESADESDSGMVTGATWQSNVSPAPPESSSPSQSQSSSGRLSLNDFRSSPPMPLTMELIERGRERYNIYCSVCHGLTGEGDGTIVRRGYTRPPAYATDESRGLLRQNIHVKLRDVPLGYFYEVISHGMGAMADYATQVPPRDRWAIAVYVRALQVSQYTPLDDLPQEQQRAARQSLETTP